MRPRARVLLIGLLAVVALVWWAAFGGRSRHEPARIEAGAHDAPPPPPPAVRAREPAAPVPPARPESSAPADAPQQPAAAALAPDTRGFVDALAYNFDSDGHEPGAVHDEAWLREVFRRAGAPAGLPESVECRRSTCKLELRWTEEVDAAYRRAMDELAEVNGKFVATRALPPDASGAVSVTAYVARAARPQPAR